MRPTDDLVYFEQRAEAEIRLAQKAVHENAVRAHYLMAGFYLDLIHRDDAVVEADSGVATFPTGDMDDGGMRRPVGRE